MTKKNWIKPGAEKDQQKTDPSAPQRDDSLKRSANSAKTMRNKMYGEKNG